MVAFLAEGVDRNLAQRHAALACIGVAFLAEGVDRNLFRVPSVLTLRASPSSRRAWIEIDRDRISTRQLNRRLPRGGRG